MKKNLLSSILPEMHENFLTPLLCLEDNFSYVLSCKNFAVVIDPTQSDPIINFLEKKQLPLHFIFCTHHHFDHTGGIPALKKRYQTKIYGPLDKRLPYLDETISENQEYNLGPFCFKIIETPGHTKSHITLYEKNYKMLFSGDTLFGAGCGRIFEGNAENMYNSLQKLTRLDEDTSIYFGHEYTLKNLHFANKILPDDPDIAKRLQQTIQLRKNRQFTIPSTIREEKKTNLFLRTHDIQLKKALNMENQSEVQVFAKLRKLRDSF